MKVKIIMKKITRIIRLQDWYCTKCDTTRLTIEQQKAMNTEQVIETLMQPCPGCKAEGYLGHYFKHS